MTLEVFCGQTAAPTTATGTTDFTSADSTTTPNAALHVIVRGNEGNGSASANAIIGIGMTDGTNERWCSISMQDAVADANTFQRNDAGSGSIGMILNTSANVDGEVSHNSWISGGQRVNNDNAFFAAHLIQHMFFDVDNAAVTTATLDATVDTAVNVDPGFAWDCVIVAGVPKSVTGAQADAEIYMGFFDRTNQGGILFNSQDATAAGDPSLQISSTYAGGEMAMGTGSLDYGIDISVGSGTSCDLTPRNNGGDGDAVFCLFLGWTSSESVSVVSWASPSSSPVTGSDSVTGVGFQPQAAIHLFSLAASYDTAEQDADGGAFAIGFSSADSQYCAGISDEYNAATTNTQSLRHNRAIYMDGDDGTIAFDATLTSFGADGWTHNYTSATSAARRFISLAFETSSSSIIPQAMYHYRHHGGI